jgi:hypothetical protein
VTLRILHLLFVLALVLPAAAKDSESTARSKWKKWLQSVQRIEAKARPVEPIHVELQKQTPAQHKEIVRRIELLDHLVEREVRPLAREIAQYRDFPDNLASTQELVKKAAEELTNWTSAKLTLQNAGVNNPSLETLRKNEPKAYGEFQKALQAAQAATR